MVDLVRRKEKAEGDTTLINAILGEPVDTCNTDTHPPTQCNHNYAGRFWFPPDFTLPTHLHTIPLLTFPVP